MANYFETEGRESLEYFCYTNRMHIEVISKQDQSIESVKIITLKRDETVTEEI